MQPLRQSPKHELVAAHLCDGLRSGRWSGSLPGVLRLAADLGVSPHTVRRALKHLEAQGVLSGSGPGRSRAIKAAGATGATESSPLRIGILRHDKSLTDDPQAATILVEILYSLEAAGYVGFLSDKSQIELRHNVPRIAKYLTSTQADAWVIEAGSTQLLEWCAGQELPCMALYGRSTGLSLAGTGPDKEPAFRDATRQLLALGHRRIVLIIRAGIRVPVPGACAQAFLEELAAQGIATSEYHLPDWEETPEGFHSLLERLFRHSPPTALIIDESARYIAAVEFLARRNIQVPAHVSLVSTDCDASLGWIYPRIAHMRWDSTRIVRRVVRWVDSVRKGKPDRKTLKFPAEFLPGGSIGPVSNG